MELGKFGKMPHVTDQFFHFCIKQQTCEHLESIGYRSCKKIMKLKTPLIAQICVLSDAY